MREGGKRGDEIEGLRGVGGPGNYRESGRGNYGDIMKILVMKINTL